MFSFSWLRSLKSARPNGRRRPSCRLEVERLEPRDCPSGSYLFVADYDKHSVLKFDAQSGDLVDVVVPNHSGGLHEPLYPILSPHDGDLYVGSGHFNPSDHAKGVLHFDADTGAFLGEFTKHATVDSTHGLIYGPDGNLYVGDWVGGFQDRLGGRILRFNGATGAYMDDFVTIGSGGIVHPFGMAFAPRPSDPGTLDLYVCNVGDKDHAGNVLRYDGTTGAFLGEFVTAPAGKLGLPNSLTFGPDGNFYISSNNAFDSGGLDAVLRYQGPGGPSPGSFLGAFVAAGSGGLESPTGLLFGPDGNNDGYQDLYVANGRLTGVGADQGRLGTVKRFDGVTGAFIDTFIPIRSGGLSAPAGLFFTETDPVTLAYLGSASATAAPMSAVTGNVSATNVEVNGGGKGLLTDDAGNVFPFHFALAATLEADGSVHGRINFTFSQPFAQAWGAVPGVDLIRLPGTVTAVTVADDGTFTLEGLATERDFARGDGLAFIEEDIPFRIDLNAESELFTLQWCELPTFALELTDGNVTVR